MKNETNPVGRPTIADPKKQITLRVSSAVHAKIKSRLNQSKYIERLVMKDISKDL